MARLTTYRRPLSELLYCLKKKIKKTTHQKTNLVYWDVVRKKCGFFSIFKRCCESQTLLYLEWKKKLSSNTWNEFLILIFNHTLLLVSESDSSHAVSIAHWCQICVSPIISAYMFIQCCSILMCTCKWLQYSNFSIRWMLVCIHWFNIHVMCEHCM